MIRKSMPASAVALASLIAATPALADPITLDSSDVGQSFTVNYDGSVNTQTVAGLTGTATFTLTSANPTAYTFDYSVKNTSSGGVGSTISSFAFDTDPTISGATSTGTYSYTVLNSNYPNQVGGVDVCFKAGSSGSCAGNGGGVTTGDTGTGTLTLDFAAPISSLTLSDFFVRYQAITGVAGGTSGTGTGVTTTSTSTTSGGTSVPEPSMILLFGIGAAGIAFASRRRRQAPKLSYSPAFA